MKPCSFPPSHPLHAVTTLLYKQRSDPSLLDCKELDFFYQTFWLFPSLNKLQTPEGTGAPLLSWGELV